MIKLSPINSNISQTYYDTLKFSLNPLTLLLNISGTFIDQNIQKSITINKATLLISNTILYNSLTVLYTYLTVDLNSYTYSTNTKQINSNDPYKPELLLFFDNSLNCINDAINLTKILYSGSSSLSTYTNNSLTSIYSFSANISNFAYISLTSLYSLTAESIKNMQSAPTINNNNINIFSIPYSKLYVGADSSTLPYYYYNDYISFYNINTKKLYVYKSNTWQEIDWKEYIKSDRLYKEGRLRIDDSTGALEIQSADGTWYEIIPTVGKTFIPTSYTNYVYYVAPNQSFSFIYSAITPIMAINGLEYKIDINASIYSSTKWLGLLPNGTFITNGYNKTIANIYSGYYAESISNCNYIPILKGYTYKQSVNLQILNNYINIITNAYSNNTFLKLAFSNGEFPKNGYYLGIWFDSTTINYTNSYFTGIITRIA
jgi:hypothetical protein